MPSPFDVVIIGGGPAGLSAALVLGRCRRSVLLCDAGAPRNAAARALHGYLSRDGIAPLELLRLGREELASYAIELRATTVTTVSREADDLFHAVLDGTEMVTGRALLIATGVADRLPEVAGIRDCYGITVHHCPYCDGWEVRDRRLAVIGTGAAAASLALSLQTWTHDVEVCTNGPARMSPTHRAQLAAHGIVVREARLVRLDHDDGHVRSVVFADGTSRPCDAVFFTLGQRPTCDIPRLLGCDITSRGVVRTDRLGQTRVPGVYVAGDASRDVQFVVVAAAEGAKAAVAINKALQERAGLTAAPEG